MSDSTGTVPNEPPTTVIATAEPATTPMTVRPDESPDVAYVQAEVDSVGYGHASVAAPAIPRPVWPGLTAAGLPTRVPGHRDEEQIKEAFAQSWEAAPTGPTPLTQAPFVPSFPTGVPGRRSWSDELDPSAAEPPEPKEPPQPAEPPEPRQPPTPPTPPGPTPFPSPTPTPPEPVPPSPPGPVPSPVPAPPVPAPPPPFPPPPAPVPPPPAIVPGTTARAPRGLIYPGGTYPELSTEPITGLALQGQTRAGRDQAREVSGTLAGHLLNRGEDRFRRRERRRKVRAVLWVTVTLLVFAAGILTVVNILAGDFIRGLFTTFAGWAR